VKTAGPVKFYADEEPFYPGYSKVFFIGKRCPVKVNTIEEPIFLSARNLITTPVKFHAFEEPFLS
jgi:hypothetical protein